MNYTHTCENSSLEEGKNILKKMPIRQKKKFIKNKCSYAYAGLLGYSKGEWKFPTDYKKEVKYHGDFIPPMNKEVATKSDILALLNKIFLINKNVKKNAYTHDEYINEYGEDDIRTTVDYDLRDIEYSRKTACIKTAIGLIKYNNLPIDYWKNEGIVYFEYRGKQVSFHDPKNNIICKDGTKEWSGIVNKKIPFILF